jgi:hypothetical protein
MTRQTRAAAVPPAIRSVRTVVFSTSISVLRTHPTARPRLRLCGWSAGVSQWTSGCEVREKRTARMADKPIDELDGLPPEARAQYDALSPEGPP